MLQGLAWYLERQGTARSHEFAPAGQCREYSDELHDSAINSHAIAELNSITPVKESVRHQRASAVMYRPVILQMIDDLVAEPIIRHSCYQRYLKPERAAATACLSPSQGEAESECLGRGLH
jgi:hypothetical protein